MQNHWLIHGLTHWWIHWLTGCGIYSLIDGWIGRSMDWLTDGLADWQVGYYRFIDWPIDRFADSSIEGRVGWFVESLIQSPIDGFVGIFLHSSICALGDSSFGFVGRFIELFVDDCVTDPLADHTHSNFVGPPRHLFEPRNSVCAIIVCWHRVPHKLNILGRVQLGKSRGAQHLKQSMPKSRNLANRPKWHRRHNII